MHQQHERAPSGKASHAYMHLERGWWPSTTSRGEADGRSSRTLFTSEQHQTLIVEHRNPARRLQQKVVTCCGGSGLKASGVLITVGFQRFDGTGTRGCLVDGDPYNPPTLGIVPSCAIYSETTRVEHTHRNGFSAVVRLGALGLWTQHLHRPSCPGNWIDGELYAER